MDRNPSNGKLTDAFLEVVVTPEVDKLNVQINDSNGDAVNHKVKLSVFQCDASGDGDPGTDIATATAGGLAVIVATKFYTITTDDTGTFSSAATTGDLLGVVSPNGRVTITTVL